MGRSFQRPGRRRAGECTLVSEGQRDMVASLRIRKLRMAWSDVLERTRSMAAVLPVASEPQALLPSSLRCGEEGSGSMVSCVCSNKPYTTITSSPGLPECVIREFDMHFSVANCFPREGQGLCVL
jgi:hypothetical protein